MAEFKSAPVAEPDQTGVSGYLSQIPGGEAVPEWVILLLGAMAVGFAIYLISRLYDSLTAGHF